MSDNLLSSIKSRMVMAVILSTALITLFQNCGVERPGVEEASYRSTAFTPESHKNLSATTQCSTCHESARPVTKTSFHNFNHLDPQWASQDCVLCHSQKERWGVSWGGGQFSHSPIPTTCFECHQNYKPTNTVFIGNDSSKPFNHTGASECATCHVNTSKFDVLSDWRPASLQPSGLVGSKAFLTSVIAVSFNGSNMVRAPAQTQNFKLEIDHDHDLVNNLSCTTCHSSSSGNFKGAFFHANIAANPAACLDCHKNALPMGAVGSKGLMRHEAVKWNTSSIGTVSRGTAPMVVAECATCHLNTSSMPPAGSPPLPGSQPFKQASYHFNTAGVSSCLDCHAHSRPQGSAGFSNATWKNKTNTGAPPFTTFNLNTHAPNVDCATCHNAPTAATTSPLDWAPGYFQHNATNLNCLNCHTASGVTSQSHASFNSNCVSCHVGATTSFPNPTIADWKNGVVSGTPSGIVGDRTILNAITCVGVLGSTPNCVASNPNVIPKGYNHTINTNAVSCQNCHGGGTSSAANGKFHTPPSGVTNWVAPAASDISNCNTCHDPTIIPSSLVSVKNLGIIGSQVNVSAGVSPFAGVNHNHSLVVGKSCVLCHTAPTKVAPSTTWNQATKIHGQFNPSQITTCSECHYKRMPAGVIARKNQATYKGVSKQQLFTHTSTVSLPSLGLQQCSACHSSGGGSWTAAGSVSFHNKVTVSKNCNLCHQAPGGVVTSSTSGVSYNHDLISNLGDCATCHEPSIAKVNARIPAVSDWDGGAGAPSTYTIPSHTTSGYTVPGYTGTHTKNTNCTSCHGTGNYKVITDFDHQGLPSNANTCVSCHLGTKADVSSFIASTSPIDMSSSAPSRHHPSSIFKNKNTSCVGCHTMNARANTFNTVNGIVFPALAKDAYVKVGCGSVNGSTFSCHEGNQRTMTVPSTATGTGGWNQ